MRIILDKNIMDTAEKLSVKSALLEFHAGSTELPEPAAKVFQEMLKAQTGFPLTEKSQLPDGRFLHILRNVAELVVIKDGDVRVLRKMTLGNVTVKYSGEIWIHLFGREVGLVESKKPIKKNIFKKLKMELTVGRLTENSKRHIRQLDKEPLLKIIQNHRPVRIRR